MTESEQVRRMSIAEFRAFKRQVEWEASQPVHKLRAAVPVAPLPPSPPSKFDGAARTWHKKKSRAVPRESAARSPRRAWAKRELEKAQAELNADPVRLANIEWEHNKNDCQSRFVSLEVYTNVRRRELAGTMFAGQTK